MKKTLAVLALIFAPVCAASTVARAQEASAPARLRFRVGDAFSGPVRTVRMERAGFITKDGARAEGPRVLISIKRYSPDGRTAVRESFAPDGSLRRKTVQRYGGDGRLLEESHYDARGALIDRKSYDSSPDETLTYDGAGRLRERRVVVWNARRDKMKEVLTYDGAGALLKRAVNTVDEAGRKSTWTTYGPDGAVVDQSVHSLDYGGPHRTEQKTFGADGSAAGSRVATSDAAVRRLEAVETNADGSVRRKSSEEREYDSRGNLSRLVNLTWNDAKGAYEAVAVTYYVTTYYD
jgi:YD repeat-containing protein